MRRMVDQKLQACLPHLLVLLLLGGAAVSAAKLPSAAAITAIRRRLVELIYINVARRRVALEVVYERVEGHVAGAVFFRRTTLPQELPQALWAELRVRGPCRAASSAARGPGEGGRQPNSSGCHLFFQVGTEQPFLLVTFELARTNPPPTSYPSPPRPATKRTSSLKKRTSGGKTLAAKL